MTGAQLLYCYDQGFDAKAVRQCNLVIAALKFWHPDHDEIGLAWRVVWGAALVRQYGQVIFNLPIKSPKNCYV